MTQAHKAKRSTNVLINDTDHFSAFDQLDGSHPWMQAVPNGYVPYRVRQLEKGEIAYFNFALAKEMGLIPFNAKEEITPELAKKLLETFNIQIINEYDVNRNKKFDSKSIKKNYYMASRYLQLQHQNKQGKTSGDGRGIWNGTVKHRGQVWDVSSRGTGVTCLAPGAVEAGKPLKTGGTQFGYGCGLAEIDELYSAALMAEILYLQGIQTERVLCIIDNGNEHGIGVRAAQNLIRPAHIFLYLKQKRFKELKSSFDYLIERQIQNKQWKTKSVKTQYHDFVNDLAHRFAKFTALLDVDYIFAWLDWDGDNVLADAGIIDYGSIRQFGIRHDRYRYDDVDRYSTNLNEQKKKAQLIVQVFCQIADQLTSGQHQSIDKYTDHPTIKVFQKEFETQRSYRILYRLGFNETQRQSILKKPDLFKKFDAAYSYFERAKISGSSRPVADGVNHPALFDLRPLSRALPMQINTKAEFNKLSEESVFKLILSNFAKSKDAQIRPRHKRMITELQDAYKEMISIAMGKSTSIKTISSFQARAQKLNQDKRMTGNALIEIVGEILEQRKSGVEHKVVQTWIDQMIFEYLDLPEMQAGRFYQKKPRLIPKAEVFEKLMQLTELHKHDI